MLRVSVNAEGVHYVLPPSGMRADGDQPPIKSLGEADCCQLWPIAGNYH